MEQVKLDKTSWIESKAELSEKNKRARMNEPQEIRRDDPWVYESERKRSDCQHTKGRNLLELCSHLVRRHSQNVTSSSYLAHQYNLNPPRARYFDVVGGLACCYDGLGYSNGVGSFLPGRFNHVVQADLEHPD